jgi:hypothetical protein
LHSEACIVDDASRQCGRPNKTDRQDARQPHTQDGCVPAGKNKEALTPQLMVW